MHMHEPLSLTASVRRYLEPLLTPNFKHGIAVKNVLVIEEIVELIVEELYAEGRGRRAVRSFALVATALTQVALRRLWCDLDSPEAITTILFANNWCQGKDSSDAQVRLFAASHRFHTNSSDIVNRDMSNGISR